MVNTHIQADNDNTKPTEGGCSRKTRAKHGQNGVKVSKHPEFLLHLIGLCTSFASPQPAWMGLSKPCLLEEFIQGSRLSAMAEMMSRP
jgi:hypothetical protein